jgi:DNA repair exonuclease SbcCD nuclease subunit
MKIAVISDLHLDKRQYRTEDGAYNRFEQSGYIAFSQYIDIINKHSPDILLWAGDMFETANPSVLAISKMQAGLDRINVPSLMVLGNHDFSFKNRETMCSSMQTVRGNIIKLAEYAVEYYHDEKEDILFVLLPFVYDKVENLNQLWQECEQLANIPAKTKILLTHGITETYGKQFPELSSKYDIPDNLINLFDVVFIGHIHTPFEYTSGKTLVISPGGLIDYQSHESHTGVVFYNTKTKKLKREIIDTPHIIKVELDETNINSFLSNVGRYIYNITYTGNVDCIDNDIYIQAKNTAVNISLTTSTSSEETNPVEKELDFYKWIELNYPDKKDLFNKAKESLVE